MRGLKLTCLALVAAGFSAAVGLGVTAAAPAPTPQQRVDAAFAAMGGAKLLALKTISFKANIHQWDPGESFSTADSDTPDVKSSDLTQSRDYAKGLVRNEWVRPRNDTGGTRTFTEIVHRHDPPTLDRHVGASRGRAGSIDHAAVLDDNVEHASLTPIRALYPSA